MIANNIKPGIVTRGYTGKNNHVILIQNGNGNRDMTGDEPLLLSKRLAGVPVAVAKKRIDGIKMLREYGCEIVIADDAFQHKNLSRDADIVLIDSTCPFGSGKLIPAGILREKISALSRANIIVLTKTDQADENELKKIYEIITKYISPQKIFESEIKHEGWKLLGTEKNPTPGKKIFAFSAIGSPESFTRTLKKFGLEITGHKNFQDHHKYNLRDIENLYNLAEKSGAKVMACTEKDLYNMPKNINLKIPVIIPEIRTAMKEPNKFFDELIKSLRPKIVVASNGYGEDAIGAVLAKKLRARFPESEIFAFPLVGRGDAYTKAGFNVKTTLSVTPSGGVLKYSLKDLIGDIRSGLFKQVRAQLRDWKKLAHEIRTPICVGDVYLLLHTLWGSGARPLFTATAKTVYLSGHWKIERAIINKFTVRTWARDSGSAEQLGKRAVYSGNPVMDLLEGENKNLIEPENLILLLPGSRSRACNDVKLLLDAAEIINNSRNFKFRMVLAPTLDLKNFISSCEAYGWKYENENKNLTRNNIKIELTLKTIAKAADGVKILIGLGGTANQLCAGLGIPVISINEKGKRVQKKLLGDSEILVNADSSELANTALKIIDDENLYKFMSEAGKKRMGHPGALDDIVNYAGENFGWDVREKVYKILKIRKSALNK